MNPKPFLKYVGSKQRMLPLLKQYLPKGHINKVIEPFCGSSAVSFFYLANGKSDKAIISDENKDLINTYLCIKYEYGFVIKYLRILFHLKATRREYYNLRHFFNVWHAYISCSYNQLSWLNALIASIYFFINKTDYNGLVRYSKRGKLNVAFNKNHQNLKFNHMKKVILADHKALQHAQIYNCDFSKTMKMAKKGDLVFIDPPYLRKDMFERYDAYRYTELDAKRLKSFCLNLTKRHVKWLQTNTDTPQIRESYSGCNFHAVSVLHLVSPTITSRHQYPELIITNYKNHPIKKHVQLASGGQYFKLKNRCRDLITLVKIRRSHRQSIHWEETLLFFYSVNYIHLVLIKDLIDNLKYINNLFKEPLPLTTINDLATEYGLSGWHFTNDQIVDRLNISKSEQLHMKTLILDKNKPLKINKQRRIKRLNSPSKRKRAKRNRKIRNLHNKGIKNKIIAQKLNISRNTVSNVINNR